MKFSKELHLTSPLLEQVILITKVESTRLSKRVNWPTIFTSNKPYSEWGEILGDSVIASAILDRILHHSITVNVKGESYRLKLRKKAWVKFPPPIKKEEKV